MVVLVGVREWPKREVDVDWVRLWERYIPCACPAGGSNPSTNQPPKGVTQVLAKIGEETDEPTTVYRCDRCSCDFSIGYIDTRSHPGEPWCPQTPDFCLRCGAPAS